MKTKEKVSKKLAKLNADIKQRNAKFAKMTAAQKRLAIAKDVLAQLKKKKFVAESGSYCTLNTSKVLTRKDIGISEGEGYKTVDIELQPLLLDGTIASCDVCAIGSVFMSKVLLGNKFKITADSYSDSGEDSVDLETDLDRDHDMVESLKGIFTEKQLRLMEYAFEGEDIKEIFFDSPEKFHLKVDEFYYEYTSDESRLKAIMQNIIKNEGTFKL